MGLMGNQVWRKFTLLILCFIFLSTIQPLFGSKVRHYKWEVAYTFWSPDCIERPVITINGQFPGPTIRARPGDTIVVELTNKLGTEGVTIHWHGIRQFGTPWADGSASIAQCPINPGETFVYRYKVEKAGTFFYHGHYGMQRTDGLYGSLIVDVAEGEKEPFHYDGEFNLLLSDWWHTSAHEQEIGLTSRPIRWVNEPQSLLINGRGQYNCTLAAGYGNYSSAPQCKFQGKEQCAPQVLQVFPRKTYRIRISNTDALGALNVAIGNHNLTVVEADGNYVEPFTVDNMDIQTGETYSVLITTDQNPNGNYWVSVGIMGRPQEPQSALTIINYLPNSASKLPTSAPPPHPGWVDYNMTVQKKFLKKVLALKGSPKPPKKYDHQIVLLSTESLFDGYSRWSINNVSLALPTTPYLGAIKYGLKNAFDQRQAPENYPQDYDIMKQPTSLDTTMGDAVYWLKFNSTIDVILQNANKLEDGESALHSWHLHGHDFWVLGYGEGKFSKEDIKKFNLKNPPLRYTAGLFPFGWTALRFVTDNPGVWAFHCHFEPHLHMGMGVVFAEGVDHLPKMPDDGFACGLTAKLFMHGKHT